MKLEKYELTLKNGATAVIGSPVAEDAEDMLNNLKITVSETDFLVKLPEECSMTVEQEEKWIQSGLDSENVLIVCCRADGKIVGSSDIRFRTAFKTRHLATVGICVRRAYWGLGIATAMLGQLIAAARDKGASVVDLEFIEGNLRAQRLYEKLGFRVVSVLPKAIVQPDGSYRSCFYMQKELN